MKVIVAGSRDFKDYNLLKGLAAKWKSQIDERAYLALINYEVHIDD